MLTKNDLATEQITDVLADHPDCLLSIICAMTPARVIGCGGGLPWKLPDDLKRFRHITLNKPVVMGRKTYESIGRPLPERRNIVVSGQSGFDAPGCFASSSIGDAIRYACTNYSGEIMIIGGASLYEATLPVVTRFYLTNVFADISGDTYFPNSFNLSEWTVRFRETHSTDEKHRYAFEFLDLERNRVKSVNHDCR